MATAQVKSKQFETRIFVFPPQMWIQKYAVGIFRLPWRPTAEARGGAGGARRLRGGRAAAAPRPGRLRAPAGPRAPRDAHRGGQLGVGAAEPVEVQRGAADVLCCSHRGGWMVLHFVLGKVGKNCRETINAFSNHLRICYLCRSAIMHEHVNFTQIISNHLKSRHIWRRQNMDMSKFSKRCLQRTDAALQVSVCCKFQSEMSEAVKAFLQKITEQMHPEVGVYLQTEDWNDDDAHPNYVEMSTRRTLRFILQVLHYAFTWYNCT